jgi:TonB-linked SusC/RagA family outer membrane protein
MGYDYLKGVSKEIVFIIFIQLIGVTVAFGQSHLVSGAVTDAQTGDPLAGVNILVVGTSTGTATEVDGHYSLKVPSMQDSLRFSYIGYKSQTVPITGRSKINISLNSEIMSGQQIVVTALGQHQNRASLSYSTQSVNTKQLERTSAVNAMVSLQGKIAGLTVSQSGEGLGAPARISLRGNRSISGGNQALFVVDGIPFKHRPQALNSTNIASINVLKGANAAAIYGSAAQNGAIIIETKTAKKNETQISLNNKFMIRQPVLNMNFQNKYAQGSNGVYDPNSTVSWGPKMDGRMVDSWSIDPKDAGEKYALLPQPNNIRGFLRTGYNLSNNISLGIGGQKSQTYISFTHLRAIGAIPNQKLKRYNALIRVKAEPNKWIELNGKLNFITQNRTGKTKTGGFSSESGDPYQSVIHSLYRIPRNIRIQDMRDYEFTNNHGQLVPNYWSPGNTRSLNPYWALNNIKLLDRRDRIMTMGSIRFNFTPALSLLTRVAYNYFQGENKRKVFNNTPIHGVNGNYILNKSFNHELYSDFLLTYNKYINKNWSVKANLGGSIQKLRNDSLMSGAGNGQGNPGLVLPNKFLISNSLNPVTNENPGSPVDVNSLYAFAKFNWKDAIYINFSGRNDWSSTLPANSRSYFYPSAGLSINLNKIINTFPDVFNLFKLRFSWAQVGSSAPFGMLGRGLVFSQGGRNGLLSLEPTIPNKNLKPEKTESYELGITSNLFENRLGLDVTFYKEETTDQLFTIELPVGSGASEAFINGGNIQNEGIEATLRATAIQTTDIDWKFNLNYSLNRNKVISLAKGRSSLIIGSEETYQEKLIPGKPYGDIYTIGFVRDEQGRVIVDNNGIPLQTPSLSVLGGHLQPDWKGSIGSTLTFHHLSLHFLITGRKGGRIYSESAAILSGFGDLKRTLKGRKGGLIFGKNFFKNDPAVKQDGTPNDIEINAQDFWSAMGSDTYSVGEPFMEDASNIRLQNLSIGYNLTASTLNKVGLSAISQVSVSLVANNVFFIYRASKNIDPQLRSTTGQNKSGYASFLRPSIRSFGINLSLKF